MHVTLSPYAGTPDLTDAALTGEWAEAMGAMAEATHVAPWCSYLARVSDEPVGLGAFKNEPDADGVVEIAYISFVRWRCRGVATDIARALVDIAAERGASRVRAHTLPAENASTGVLARNGFEKVAEIDDPEDGPVWRWDRTIADGSKSAPSR